MGNIPIYSAEKRPSRTKLHHACAIAALAGGIAITGLLVSPDHVQAQAKRPNIVMLMTDDTGWNDFGAYSGGGAALGHPTPNVDQIAEEGATFTELVRPGELHRRPRLVHHRAHPDPLGALDRRRARRSRTISARRRRRSPSSSRRTATRPTSPASGIWATSPTPIRSSTASTR